MTDRKLPQKIFLDPRVAVSMPNSQEEAGEALAQGSAKPVAYVLEEYHTKRVREAANIGKEIIVQIVSLSWQESEQGGSDLVGLSNHGRLFIRESHYIQKTDHKPAHSEWRWALMDLPELAT